METDSFRPPDNNLAVGAGWVVEATNIMLRMQYGQHVAFVHPSAVTGCSTLGDPRVEFDPLTQRFFLVVIGSNSEWCLAVSASSNPTGGWHQYRFKPAVAWFGSTWGFQQPFPDYPGLGITADKVVLTGNLFHGLIGIARVKHSGVAVINKSNVVNGQGAAWWYFAPPKLPADGVPGPTFFLQPCVHYWNSSDNTTYLAGTNAWADPVAERLAMYTIVGTPGVTPTYLWGPYFYDFPKGRKWPIPPRAKQKGSTARIETNDHRVLDVVCQGNRMTVAAHHGSTPPGDDKKRTALRYMMFDWNGAGFALARDTRVRERGRYYYYPSIAVNAYGEMVSVFNRSSAHLNAGEEYPSVYAGGIRPWYGGTDAFSARVLLKAGLSPYVSDRWGDYSGTHLADNLVDVWTSGQYPIDAATWGTWISFLPRDRWPQ